MTLIGLDFETYSAADLRVVGLHNYMADQTFRPLLAAVATTHGSQVLDFASGTHTYRDLANFLEGGTIVAHNAGFEQAVLRKIGLDYPSNRFVDSAVLARANGFGSGLAAAAPQILGIDKIEEGVELIKLFSIPGERQTAEIKDFDPFLIALHHDKWEQFKYYCQVDAELSLRIAQVLIPNMDSMELMYAAITLTMNHTGWPVDVTLVKEMQRRYNANLHDTEINFRIQQSEDELNLNSHKQLVEWCAANGVRATSFDERHVKRLIARLEKRLEAHTLLTDQMRIGYQRVLDLLLTKQELGGSSLKKLDTILNQVGKDGRLRDQYLHVGAGATFRTSGRGVQMQNLKRLTGDGDDMAELLDPDVHWDNGRLATNLRQVFTASDPDGVLIVGDFSSVESRGLAWQADEEWKLIAYRKGHDLYKVQAGRIYDKDPADVTKQERQIGKVAELACGYGAGPGAVKAFAENMGVELDEKETLELVRAWRKANEGIVQYWYELDSAMRRAVLQCTQETVHRSNMDVHLQPVDAPASLRKQVGDDDLLSLRFSMHTNLDKIFTRTIHGTTLQGRNIRYWKPSDRKTGDLWSDKYTDVKTGLTRQYSVYGGKLTGLLTQSLCREVFFRTLHDVHDWVDRTSNLRLIGQFHDEIVLEWDPVLGGISKEKAMAVLEAFMSQSRLRNFPMAAEIKADHRYIK